MCKQRAKFSRFIEENLATAVQSQVFKTLEIGVSNEPRRKNVDNLYDVISRMNEFYPTMSKGHKAIAKYISEHYEEAVFMTAAKLAEKVGVSEATVVRFASGLGFHGYPEFQEALEVWVKNKIGTMNKVSVTYGNSSHSEILNAVLSEDMNKIKDTMVSMDPIAFEMAVDMILEAKDIYIVGVRSCEPLANILQFYLNMIRKHVFLVKTNNMTEMFEQMLHIDGDDLVIGISFPRYSMRTLKAMEYANDRHAKVVTITDTIHSPMNLYSSCNLLARSDSISIVDSLVAPLSVINALVVALCLKQKEQVRENLTQLEDAWENYQVYLNDEINFIDEEKMFSGLTSLKDKL